MSYMKCRSGRLMKQAKDRGGYPTVCLAQKKLRHTMTVHKLVLMAFSGPPAQGLQARHLDGNQLNNDLSNLVWGTPKENSGDDRRAHGTIPRGERHDRAILSEAQVKAIKLRLANGESQSALAREHGVTKHCIGDIARGKNWKHI